MCITVFLLVTFFLISLWFSFFLVTTRLRRGHAAISASCDYVVRRLPGGYLCRIAEDCIINCILSSNRMYIKYWCIRYMYHIGLFANIQTELFAYIVSNKVCIDSICYCHVLNDCFTGITTCDILWVNLVYNWIYNICCKKCFFSFFPPLSFLFCCFFIF